MPSLHILSTEEKETIQRKLQNGYFMFRERSANPPRWCYSTVEKQNRNEIKSQPSSFGSLQRTSRNPQLQSTWGAQAWTSSHCCEKMVYSRCTRTGNRSSLGDHRSYSCPRTCLWAAQRSSGDAQFPKGINANDLGFVCIS